MLIRNALAKIQALSDDRPTVPENPTEADLDPWRDRIDAIDVAVVSLLNERSVCANHIGEIKKHLDISVYVPTREAEVMSNVVSHNPGPLPDPAVRRVFERIIDETRSLERHLFQDDSPTRDDALQTD